MLKNKVKLIVLLLLTGLSGCDFLKTKEQKETTGSTDKPVARVFSKYLYQNDLSEANKTHAPADERAALEKKFITEWIEQQLMLMKAETVIDPNSDDIQKKLADFRQNLLIYEYEKEFLKEKLDTSVSEETIKNYYQKNINLFHLKQNIIKGYYIKFPNNTPRLDRIKTLMWSEKQKDKTELKSYCLRFSPFYNLDATIWLNFDDLIKNSPLAGISNKTVFVENTKFAENNDAHFTYFLRITEYKTSHAPTPLELVKQDIKSTIINERKIKLIKELRSTIYKEAKEKKDLEVYK